MKIQILCAVVMLVLLAVLYVASEYTTPSQAAGQASTPRPSNDDNAMRGLRIQ
jgi:hypothetical protein